jgi:hypothetical protein
MKRRQFLKAPAVTLLLPASGALGSIATATELFAEPQRPANLDQFPQRLHQDFITYRPGVEYFFLGNGDIHAILQYQPDRSGTLPLTFLGLTLMDAERFSRKWSTYLFHPERGFERTMLNVTTGGKSYAVTPAAMEKVAWTQKDGVPVVVLSWKAGDLAHRKRPRPCPHTELCDLRRYRTGPRRGERAWPRVYGSDAEVSGRQGRDRGAV